MSVLKDPNTLDNSPQPVVCTGGLFAANWHLLLVEGVLCTGSISLGFIAFTEIASTGLTTSGWTAIVMSLVLAAIGVLYFVGNPPRSSSALNRLFAARPDLVEIHANGRVVVAGHRVSLFAIMENMEELSYAPHAIRELCCRFPTIDSEQMAEVVNFVRLHQNLLRAYYAGQNRLARKTMRELERETQSPTIEELRRRREERLHSA